jgi:hypothetical protein
MSTKTETIGEKKAISVRRAVAKAMSAVKELYVGVNTVDLALEEVEMSEDGHYWLITLGFFLPSKRPVSPFESVLRKAHEQGFERRYKLFKVDAATGKVEAMKIRSV